ncbi:MAG: alanine:cation symporter family protein, partial [Candidatus Riflebacteria bacterium]
LVYIALIPIGAAFPIELIWNLSDIANGLMAFPNLIGLLGLSGVAYGMMKDYEARLPQMKPYQ